MLPPLRDWNNGDSNRDRAHFQEPVNALREIDRQVSSLSAAARDHSQPVARRTFLGKIVASGPAGEADKTNCQYWIQEQLIEGAQFRAALTLSEDTTNAAFEGEAPNTHLATNL